MVLTWMGSLMYLCDGHMVYDYSFLVYLDILIPLVQLIFSFKKLQDIYGSLGLLATYLPRKISIKHTKEKIKFF